MMGVILTSLNPNLQTALSINSVIKGLLLAYLIFYGLKSKISIYFTLTFLCILIIPINLINIIGDDYFITNISILLKIIFNISVILYFIFNVRSIGDNIYFLRAYCFITVIPNSLFTLLGFSELTYSYSDYGLKGIFSSTNDAVVSYVLTAFLIIYNLRQSKYSYYKIDIIFLFLIILQLLITGTRTSFIFGFIILFFAIFTSFKKKMTVTNVTITLFLIAITFLSINTINNQLVDNQYIKGKFLNIFKGDDTYYNSPRARAYDAAIQIFKSRDNLFFGHGYKKFCIKVQSISGVNSSNLDNNGKHTEKDTVDILGSFGIFGLLFILSIYFKLASISLKGINQYMIFIAILCYSHIAGHILINPLIYIPIAVFFNTFFILNNCKVKLLKHKIV